MGQPAKTSFVRGATFLVIAGLLSRFLGLFYRVILNHTAGMEVAGLYQFAYPMYTLLLVVSVTGIPVSLAKLVSEKLALGREGDAYRIFQITRKFALAFGSLFAVLMIVMAKPYLQITQINKDTFYSLIALAPAIFVVSIMATYRGFFQGMQDMKPTAVSQVVEQIVRMVTIVALSLALLPMGSAWAAAGATFSAVTGAIAGLLIMWYFYRKNRVIFTAWRNAPVSSEPTGSIIKQMTQYAIPVIISGSMGQLMALVSSSLVSARLQHIGFTANQATTLFGELGGIALTLIHFPEIITVSLQVSLIPAITSAYTLGLFADIRSRALLGVRLALLTSTPAAVGLFVLAKPLADLFGKNPTPNAAISLQILSVGVIFIAIQQVTSGVFQGIEKVMIPVKNMFVGVVVNAVLTYCLTATPALGINGNAIATMLGFTTVSILNIVAIQRVLQCPLTIGKMLVRPGISSIIMGFSVLITYHGIFALIHRSGMIALSKIAGVGVAVPIGMLIYLVSMIGMNGLTIADLQQIPGGGKLIPLLQRCGLLRTGGVKINM